MHFLPNIPKAQPQGKPIWGRSIEGAPVRGKAALELFKTFRVGRSANERKADTIELSDIDRIERAVKNRAASIADDEGFSL